MLIAPVHVTGLAGLHCSGTKRRHQSNGKSRFSTILRSKLLYGFETIQLNLADQKKIDSFQMNGYRRVLHIPPTSIDRTLTNDHVKYQISNHLNTEIKWIFPCGYNVRCHFLVILLDLNQMTGWDKFCLELQKTQPRISFGHPGKPRQQWLSTTICGCLSTTSIWHGQPCT